MNEARAYRYPEGRIILFAKAPVAGEVKTRLAAGIGTEAAATVYAQLLSDTLGTATRATLAPVELHVASDGSHPVLTSLAEQYHLAIRQQMGSDLGERMCNALADSLRTSAFALLIGSDCPVITAGYLERACRALASGSDAVLGPVEDGGYVLIGLRRCDRRLFTDIPWSSSRVSETTRARLRALDFGYTELETLWDIDTAEDLTRWQAGTRSAVTG